VHDFALGRSLFIGEEQLPGACSSDPNHFGAHTIESFSLLFSAFYTQPGPADADDSQYYSRLREHRFSEGDKREKKGLLENPSTSIERLALYTNVRAMALLDFLLYISKPYIYDQSRDWIHSSLDESITTTSASASPILSKVRTSPALT
jgi:hypothetical protein